MIDYKEISEIPDAFTVQEYERRKMQIGQAIADLGNYQTLLNLKWVRQAPFQRGDKVKVTIKKKIAGKEVVSEVICFIASVNPWPYFGAGEYAYTFNKSKKNGEMAEMGAGIHYYDSIEKIE